MRDCSYLDPRAQLRCTECGNHLDLCGCEEVDDKAHERLWAPAGKTAAMIREEVDRAMGTGETNLHLLAKLNAEMGQLNYQLYVHDEISRVQGETGEPGVTAEEVYRSLVRVCALATRLAIEGDPDFAYDSLTIFGEDTLIKS